MGEKTVTGGSKESQDLKSPVRMKGRKLGLQRQGRAGPRIPSSAADTAASLLAPRVQQEPGTQLSHLLP